MRTDGEAPNLTVDQTIPYYRVIYLQRLANPLLPYNNDPTTANYNPYRTIDMMSVDMTAFNGFEKNEPGASGGTTYFQAHQRGETNDVASAMNIWKQEIIDKSSLSGTNAADITGHVFNKGLKHSLGYLNQPFGAPTSTPFAGAPSLPFPWLTWNGRPFVNPLELLLVPTCSSSKLLVNASTGSTGTLDTTYNKYFNIIRPSDSVTPYAPTIASGNTTTLTGAGVPYPHLMNFFQSTPSMPAGASPQFHRILEYVGVPSPFVGTETWLNPSYTADPFQPPFNRISAYREPGRINLNTIYSPAVFQGLMNYFPSIADSTVNLATSWQTFINSRSGAAVSPTNILALPTSLPTEFARPFRSFGGWSYMPSVCQPPREIDCTLLRPADPTTPTRTLFQTPDSTNAYNSTYQNPYFRYQSLMRLSNLVTTRSNVFAVWITVGYFQVTPNPGGIDATHPDGYQLGREVGSDSGEIERHRAFYIFDRTIPVGFQRGQDLNVEKAILLDRYIE
jgi:hypothetical protein